MLDLANALGDCAQELLNVFKATDGLNLKSLVDALTSVALLLKMVLQLAQELGDIFDALPKPFQNLIKIIGGAAAGPLKSFIATLLLINPILKEMENFFGFVLTELLTKASEGVRFILEMTNLALSKLPGVSKEGLKSVKKGIDSLKEMESNLANFRKKKEEEENARIKKEFAERQKGLREQHKENEISTAGGSCRRKSKTG